MPDRPLHIAVDGRELVGRPTGVGRYLREVLTVWAHDQAFPHRVTAFAPVPPPAEILALGGRIEWHTEPGASAGTLWEQLRLPAAVQRSGADVFLAPGYTAPLRLRMPYVVVIHDVSFFARPASFGTREGIRRRWLTRSAARRAACVLTDSQFSTGEIVRWLGIPADRVRLAPCGVPPPVDPAAHSERPVVLYVGSLFTRRNIPALINAFALVVQAVPLAHLILVGENRTRPRIDPAALAAAAGIPSHVELRDYVDDAELDRLYRQARVFVFLSDYEGFALTPFEAMAHGVPPVMLDTPVSREIQGAGARLVPLDPKAIAGALSELLTDDRAHAALVAAGRARLADFSWARTAGAIRDALEEAARAR